MRRILSVDSQARCLSLPFFAVKNDYCNETRPTISDDAGLIEKWISRDGRLGFRRNNILTG